MPDMFKEQQEKQCGLRKKTWTKDKTGQIMR